METILIAGSGFSRSFNAVNKNNRLIPTDQNFWANLFSPKFPYTPLTHAKFQEIYPALWFLLNHMRISSNYLPIRSLGLEAVWNMVDILHNYAESNSVFAISEDELKNIPYTSYVNNKRYNNFFDYLEKKFSKGSVSLVPDENNKYRKERGNSVLQRITSLCGWELLHLLTEECSFEKNAQSFTSEAISSFFSQLAGVITFNYDTVIESIILTLRNNEWSYSEVPNKKRILKLHGSLNWKIDSNNLLHPPMQGALIIKPDLLPKSLAPISLSYTQEGMYTQPFIVPPVSTKTANLHAEEYKPALSYLENADCWIFWGYGFPLGDYYVDTMLRFAYRNRSKGNRPGIININPDQQHTVTKIEQILGHRPDEQISVTSWEAISDELVEILKRWDHKHK